MRRGLCVALLAAVAVSAAAASDAGAAALPLPAGMPPQLERAAREIGGAAGRSGAGAPPVPSFHVDAAGGYRVEVIPVGSSVAVAVAKRNGKSESVYLARGIVTPRRLKASFGGFGEVDMRFRPGGAAPRAIRSCHGRHRYATRRGVFTGRFRFRGEDSYVKVRAHRAAGEQRRLRARCVESFFAHFDGASDSVVFYPSSPFSSEELGAEWRDGPDASTLLSFSGASHILYLAEFEETRGAVAIARLAFTIGPKKGLWIDTALTAATLSPPAPFHGIGRYRASPDGEVSWEGPLAVNFPGLSRYPLTGERYRTSVWRAY